MRDEKFASRSLQTQRMTKDGLKQRDAVTQEEKSVSQRKAAVHMQPRKADTSSFSKDEKEQKEVLRKRRRKKSVQNNKSATIQENTKEPPKTSSPAIENQTARESKLRFQPPANEFVPQQGLFDASTIREKRNSAARAATSFSNDSESAQQDEIARRSMRTGASALRFTKRSAVRTAEYIATKPYRKTGRKEVSVLQERMKFERTAAESKLESLGNSNPLSRFIQRRRIKQKYAKAYRDATKLAKTKTSAQARRSVLKTGGNAIQKAIIRTGGNKLLAVLLAVFLIFVVLFEGCVSLLGGFAGVAGSSYLAETPEILAAENHYAAMENALQSRLDNYASLNPQYDAYVYHLDNIYHDPHELTAYLTAVFEGYTLDTVQSALEQIFNQQYLLTETVKKETRYYTDNSTDPPTEISYEYRTVTVKLENKGLSHLAATLTDGQHNAFSIYRITLGNMPLLFGGGSDYGGESVDISAVEFVQNPSRHGNPQLVQIALSQVGNVGGVPYWSWYGFSSRVEWCACFVSWCINQSGYDAPRFSSCTYGGMAWFSAHNQWSSSYHDIAAGDLIFFDWDNSGNADHVGIVIGRDTTHVYTIEGNSGDACKIRSYPLDSAVIRGYGLMEW